MRTRFLIVDVKGGVAANRKGCLRGPLAGGGIGLFSVGRGHPPMEHGESEKKITSVE